MKWWVSRDKYSFLCLVSGTNHLVNLLFYNLICLIVIEFKLNKIKKELQKAQKDLEESIAEYERLVGEDK